MSSTEDPGTGPPIEDGLPVGPTLGAVLSKFCYVVLVGNEKKLDDLIPLSIEGGLCAWHWMEAFPNLPRELHP